jgi:hypothetical protein
MVEKLPTLDKGAGIILVVSSTRNGPKWADLDINSYESLCKKMHLDVIYRDYDFNSKSLDKVKSLF